MEKSAPGRMRRSSCDALRGVLDAFATPALPIQIAYPSSRLVPAKLRAFIEAAGSRDWHFP